MSTNVGFLKPVFDHDGPFATVCLDSGRVAEDAVQAVALRWRNLRDELTRAGADRATLKAMDSVAGTKSPHQGEEGQVVVAAAGEVLLEERLTRAPERDEAWWSPIPNLMPLLRGMAPLVPHLLVRVDRTGADIETYGLAWAGEEQVEGLDQPISKVRAGGWSQRRYQQRAENTWEHNAKEVACRIDKLAARHAARLVVVAGDVRARSALLEHASGRVRPLIVELESGGRRAGGDEVDNQTAHLVAERVAADRASVIDTLRRRLGRDERAVQGLEDTVDYLRRAQVDTLVIEDDPHASTRLWVGPHALALGQRSDDLTGAMEGSPRRVPAEAAIIRAAAAGDARVLLAEPGTLRLREGIGALLR